MREREGGRACACADVIRSSKETWTCSVLQLTKSSSERKLKDSREKKEERRKKEGMEERKMKKEQAETQRKENIKGNP